MGSIFSTPSTPGPSKSSPAAQSNATRVIVEDKWNTIEEAKRFLDSEKGPFILCFESKSTINILYDLGELTVEQRKSIVDIEGDGALIVVKSSDVPLVSKILETYNQEIQWNIIVYPIPFERTWYAPDIEVLSYHAHVTNASRTGDAQLAREVLSLISKHPRNSLSLFYHPATRRSVRTTKDTISRFS